MRVEIPGRKGPIELPIESEKSFLMAQVIAAQPNKLFFYLNIDSLEVKVPYTAEEKEEYGTENDNYTELCTAEISDLNPAIQNWRDLAGYQFDVDYSEEEIDTILPDSPSTFYFHSRHHTPDRNRLRFGRRRGTVFSLTWDFVVWTPDWDVAMTVAIAAELRLESLEVIFSESQAPTIPEAMKIVSKYASHADFADSELYERSVSFRFRDDAD